MTLSAEEQALLDGVKVPKKRRPKYQDDWRKPSGQTARGGSDVKVAKQIVDDVMQSYGRQISGAAQSGAGKRYYGPCRCAKCRK